MAIEDTVSSALCGVMEQALIAQGVAPLAAAALAKRACEPVVEKGVTKTKKTVKKGTRAAQKKLSSALKQANKQLRTKSGKLRKGKTQRDVMRLAQKIRRRM